MVWSRSGLFPACEILFIKELFCFPKEKYAKMIPKEKECKGWYLPTRIHPENDIENYFNPLNICERRKKFLG